MHFSSVSVFPVFLMTASLLAQVQPAPEAVPSRDAVRGEINALIARFQTEKKKADLGMLDEAIDLSIAYGAPSWNQGDHAACADFYGDTIRSLCKAFPGPADATPAAAAALDDFRTALTHITASTSSDESAWILRYAFDKTALAVDFAALRASALVKLGTDNLKRGQFAEAADAFASASASLDELGGRAPAKIPLAARFAPLAESSALFGEKKYREAAAAASQGLATLPEIIDSKEDLRAAFGDPAVYESVLADLKDKAAHSPQDADLQFLLGYQYFFTGHKTEAQDLLTLTLKLNPAYPGAKPLLQSLKKELHVPDADI
jgi:tetratricopeptide (TPR) repeat protein